MIQMRAKTTDLCLPAWQSSPVFYDDRESNENILRSNRTSSQAAKLLSFENGTVVIGEFLTAEPGDVDSEDPLHGLLLALANYL